MGRELPQRRTSGVWRRFLLTTALLVLPAVLPGDDDAPLASRHQRWIGEASVLMTSEEHETFIALDDDSRRDLFIEHFWRSRDPDAGTVRNEFRDLWEGRLAQARQRFGTLQDVRAQTLLLIGEPAAQLFADCSSAFSQIEVWTPAADVLPDRSVVFAKRDDQLGSHSIWWSDLGFVELIENSENAPDSQESFDKRLKRGCEDWEELLMSLQRSISPSALRQETVSFPPPTWLADFRQAASPAELEASTLEADLEIGFPGRRDRRTVVEARLTIATESLTDSDEAEVRRFVLDGEVLRRGDLHESFRYRFDLPIDSGSTEPVVLTAQRHLHPGAYTLRVRVENLDTQRTFRASRQIEVPIIAAGGAEAPATVSTTPDARSITLLPPAPGLHTGRLRIEARTTGEGIAAVAFELNGKRLMSKRRPPWSIEVDLGHAPRIHKLRAVALGPAGDELLSDQIHVNAGPQHFEVRLVEPARGERYEDSLQARAVVDVPRGKRLDRLEFYLNEQLLSTLYQGPFVQPLSLPEQSDMAYVRAVAYLDDGHSTESLVFINSPAHLGRLDVDMVELYTTVVDKRGRPVEGLTEADFEVRENDVVQQIRRFELASEVPFHAAVVLDTSTSMAEELREAVKAALAFFNDIVTPRDRAAVITFADEPSLIVPFTNDLAALAGSVAEIEASGETVLHDAIVFTLYHFGGLTGQRALILLSDGEDSLSEYSFAEALEFARETGVAIYTIGLDISSRAHEARSKMMRLSNQTGGRSFFISRAAELERVYRTIEGELRSQYLIAYQSSLEEDGFREVEVRLDQPGLEAKTISGYNP